MIRTILLIGSIACLTTACGGNGTYNENGNSDAPAAFDSTTKHPNGVTNGSVISTDTAAMRVVDSTEN